MQRVSRDCGLANILILDFWPLERISVHCVKPASLWYFVTVSQFSHSVIQSSPALCDPRTAARQASQSITNSQSLPKLRSTESEMPFNHLILCHPVLLLLSIFPSIRVFSNESALCIRWQKYWSFSFNISPSNEHPGLISFRMDCYSAIKKNTFESVLMRWMKLEPIIQTEVSQKEKHKYSILTHIYGI